MSAAAKSRRPSIIPYAVLTGLCIALGIVGLMLRGKADRADEVVLASKKQFEAMKQAARVLDHPADPEIPRTVERTEKWKDHLGYLSTVQGESGIMLQNMPSIREAPEGNFYKGETTWSTFGVSINVKSPPNQPLTMSQMAIFLDRVERDQPFLKSTSLSFAIPEGNVISTGDIELRYWIRKPPE